MGNTFKGGMNNQIGKKPFKIIVPRGKGNGMPVEWLNQAKEVHKEFGREGLLAFFRETEKRDGAPKGSCDILLPLFGEDE